MKRNHLSILLAVAFIEVLTHFGVITPDSLHFFHATEYFLGWSGDLPPVGAVRPLLPLLTTTLAPFIGISMSYAVINAILYPISGIICYKLTQRLTRNSLTSLISSVMFLTSVAMIAFGASAYYMGLAILSELLVALLALDVWRSRLNALFRGIISGILALSGEATLPYILFGGILALRRKKYDETIIYLILSALPPLLVPTLLGYNLLQFYLKSNIGYAQSIGYLDLAHWFDPFTRIKFLAVGTSLLMSAGLAIGFLVDKNEDRAKTFYIMFGLTFLAWLTWVPSERRHVYIFYPSISWMSGIGVYWICETLSQKPILNKLSFKQWLIILLVLNALLSNLLAAQWYVGGYLHPLGSVPGLSLPPFLE